MQSAHTQLHHMHIYRRYVLTHVHTLMQVCTIPPPTPQIIHHLIFLLKSASVREDTIEAPPTSLGQHNMYLQRGKGRHERASVKLLEDSNIKSLEEHHLRPSSPSNMHILLSHICPQEIQVYLDLYEAMAMPCMQVM